MPTTKFLLTNLNCAACGKVSQMKLGKIPGVTSVVIDQDGRTAEGRLEADRELTQGVLQSALEGTDYQVKLVE